MQINPYSNANFLHPSRSANWNSKAMDPVQLSADKLEKSHKFEIYKKSWVFGSPGWQRADAYDVVKELGKTDAAPVRATPWNGKQLKVASHDDLIEMAAFASLDVKKLPSPLLAAALQTLEGRMFDGQKLEATSYEAYNILTQDPNHTERDLTIRLGAYELPLTNPQTVLDLAYLQGLGDGKDASGFAVNLRILHGAQVVPQRTLTDEFMRLSGDPEKALVLRSGETTIAALNAKELAALSPTAVRNLKDDVANCGTLRVLYPRHNSSYWQFYQQNREKLDWADFKNTLPRLDPMENNVTPLLEAMLAKGDLEAGLRKMRPYLGLKTVNERLRAFENEPAKSTDLNFYQTMIRQKADARTAREICDGVPNEDRALFKQTQISLTERGIEDASALRFLAGVVRQGKLKEHAPLLTGLFTGPNMQKLDANYREMIEKVTPGCEAVFVQFLGQGLSAREAAEMSKIPQEQLAIFQSLSPSAQKLAPESIQLGRLQQDAAALERLTDAADYKAYRGVPEGRGELYLQERAARLSSERASLVAARLDPKQEKLFASTLKALEGNDEAHEMTAAAVIFGRLAEDSPRLAQAGTLERYRAMVDSGHEEFFLELKELDTKTALKLARNAGTDELQTQARKLLKEARPEVVAEAAVLNRMESDAAYLPRLGGVEQYQAYDRLRPTLQGHEDAFLDVAAQTPASRIETAWTAVGPDSERLGLWHELREKDGEARATRLLAATPAGTDLDLVRGLIGKLGEKAPEGLETAAACGNPNLALGLLAAGSTPAEAIELAQVRLPGEELGSLEQGRILASLGRVLPDARAAVDAYHFLASQIDQPSELPQAADFLVGLQTATGDEREARLAFNDLTERTLDETHGEVMLDALSQLKTYAATRPVWDSMEAVPADELVPRVEVAKPFLEMIPAQHRGRLLEQQVQQPLTESTWRSLARLLGSRPEPVGEPVFTQLVSSTFNALLPEEMRRKSLEDLSMLSQGGARLELAWTIRPYLPATLTGSQMSDWGEALRLTGSPEMAMTLARCGGDVNPVHLAKLADGRKPAEFESFYARLSAEKGQAAVPFLSGLRSIEAERTWDTLSRPVRGETSAARQEKFEQLLAAGRGSVPTALANWEIVTRELGHPDPLGEPFATAVQLAGERPLTRDLLATVLRPLGETELTERAQVGRTLLNAYQGDSMRALQSWELVEGAVPAEKFLSTLEAVAPLGNSLGDGLPVVVPDLPGTTLEERVAAYSALDCEPRQKPVLWQETRSLLTPREKFAELLEAVAHLTRQSGSLQTVRSLRPIKDETVGERIMAYSAIANVYPGNDPKATRLWGRIVENMRKADTVPTTARALAELAACLKSSPARFDSTLDRLNEMRNSYGPAKDRSLYLLVHTLVTVTLNRTTDLDQALKMLPDDLPAVIGIEENEKSVQVGSVTVKRREGSNTG